MISRSAPLRAQASFRANSFEAAVSNRVPAASSRPRRTSQADRSGSASASTALTPMARAARARLTATVVLPAPPLRDITASVFNAGLPDWAASPRPGALKTPQLRHGVNHRVKTARESVALASAGCWPARPGRGRVVLGVQFVLCGLTGRVALLDRHARAQHRLAPADQVAVGLLLGRSR